jgi:hypothetical protein
MPWTEKDAPAKTHYADTPEKRERWAREANGALARGDTDATAIRKANRAVHPHPGRGRASDNVTRRAR